MSNQYLVFLDLNFAADRKLRCFTQLLDWIILLKLPSKEPYKHRT